MLTDIRALADQFLITKTDAKNKERLCALIDDAEEPGERLATLFEPEVLPPEAGVDGDEGGEDGERHGGDQGL